MGKRAMTFEEKAARAARAKFQKCPICQGELVPTRVVKACFNPQTKKYRFTDEIIKVCGCNQKEVYG